MNPKKLNRLVEIARALHEPDSDNRCYHITFVIKKKILSIGINSSKTHARSQDYSYQGRNGEDLRQVVGKHSELAAVIKMGYQESYEDFSFVNIRLGKTGKLLNSRPCIGCASMLHQIKPKKVFYSTNEGTFEEFQY